jgi:hypothetical protein
MGIETKEGNAVSKFEIRNSKFETNSNSQIRISLVLAKAQSACKIFRFEFVSNFGFRVSSFALLTLLLLPIAGIASVDLSSNRATVLIVVGAPGEAEFGSNFVQQASIWQKACAQGNLHPITIGLSAAMTTNDYEDLKQALSLEPKEGTSELYIVLIGHGTFDGKEARFNLRGPDVSATELAEWVKPFQRPLALIDTSSSSAPFLNKLSGTNHVIITATRSGNEQNFTRFGQYFAEAITGTDADLDKDGQVSLLEAFLIASRRTGEFYKVEGRLATEHALIDDNGDGLGTQADWFRGLRAVKAPKDKAAVDGELAQRFHLLKSEAENKLTEEQRKKRDQLENTIVQFREEKGKISDDEYYRGLEKIFLELAQLYQTNSASPVPTKTNSSE